MFGGGRSSAVEQVVAQCHLVLLDHIGGKGAAACLAATAAATGDVDQEDPPPAAGLQQPPACEGRNRGGHPAEPGPRPDRAGAVGGLEGRLDDRQARRCHQRASDALHGPRGDEPSDAGRGRAQHRRQGEPAQPGQEHPPPPPPVAERAGQQKQCSQSQRVARDCPLQVLEAGVQVPSDRRQRDDDHGGVDPCHRRPQDHRREHPPALRGAVGEQFARAGAAGRALVAQLSPWLWCHWPDLPCRPGRHGAGRRASPPLRRRRW